MNFFKSLNPFNGGGEKLTYEIKKLNKFLSRSSTYYLMKKIGLVKLKPRPRHEKK